MILIKKVKENTNTADIKVYLDENSMTTKVDFMRRMTFNGLSYVFVFF